MWWRRSSTPASPSPAATRTLTIWWGPSPGWWVLNRADQADPARNKQWAAFFRGQGHAGKNGGPSGDLLITITVRPHELFRREGTSVLCEAPITFAQAVLGAELEIPTIDGKVKYDLPEGTQSGTTFRLKGKGIPELNGRGRGDQYVTVYIETPRNLNREQKEALKKFAESVGDNNYEERKKFFKKFKK